MTKPNMGIAVKVLSEISKSEYWEEDGEFYNGEHDSFPITYWKSDGLGVDACIALILCWLGAADRIEQPDPAKGIEYDIRTDWGDYHFEISENMGLENWCNYFPLPLPNKSYKFEIGNSTKGKLGLVARVNGDTPEEALTTLKELLFEEYDISKMLNWPSDGQYVCVYTNYRAITVEDIDHSETEEDGPYELGDPYVDDEGYPTWDITVTDVDKPIRMYKHSGMYDFFYDTEIEPFYQSFSDDFPKEADFIEMIKAARRKWF